MSTSDRAPLVYLSGPIDISYRPPAWYAAGRQQTASGYGRKLSTPYVVRLPGDPRWRRVYVTLFSNAGTSWIRYQGKDFARVFPGGNHSTCPAWPAYQTVML